jgi:hypothetical protein
MYQETRKAGYVLKLNKFGNLVWEHHFLTGVNTEFYSLAEDIFGNVFVGGNSYDATVSNLCVVKIRTSRQCCL